jgi:tetratricopeptide (TPR) repeat protein
MASSPPNERVKLLTTLRSGASSFRATLSQLVTRRKGPQLPPQSEDRPPAPEGPRWGPLVLLDKVGEGAFGEVYRAWDAALEREVALKLMRGAEDPALLREARILARLRHPNIVTVYGADRHDGRSGIWMDFIQGDTLAAIVEERGAFGAREALLVGVDVCRALAAAHQRALLHRDIKAENVMRERGGRIVLMDFGLGHEAGGIAADFGGTPLYMAPELFHRAPPTVHSDLYAVGVLLFHLVTGDFPVRGSTLGELRAGHSARAHQTLRDVRSDLPSSFVHVVERALVAEPSRRYGSAGQMTAALEAALGTRRFPPISRRALWPVASSLAALAALAGWREWLRPSPAVKQGASLLLSEISNATGDRQLDATIDVLRVQIAQSAHFNLLEPERVKETLARMTKPADQKLDLPVAREVALRSGTPLLVYGTLSPLGSGYGLDLMMERIEGQPNTPVTTETNLFRASGKNGLFDTIHQAATWIRQTAGEAGKDISANDTAPEEATTRSWEALEYFTRGERLKNGKASREAMSMYQQAVRIDPEFAIALARLASEQHTQRLAADSFASYKRAVDALGKRRVTRREDLRIRGLYAIETENFTQAEELMHTFTLLYPRDSLAHHYHAFALRNLGRLEEARSELLEAQRLRPAEANLMNLVAVALLLGRPLEAADYVEKLSAPVAANYRGQIKFLVRDYAGAEAAFAAASTSRDARMRSLGMGARAALLAELGRYQEAVQALEQGIAAELASGNSAQQARMRLSLGHLYLLAGRRDAARLKAREAAHQDSDTLALLRAGSLLARAGFPADARSIGARMNAPDQGRRFETAQAILTAEIALAEGRTADAITGFEKADRLTAPIRPRVFLARAWEKAGRSADALDVWGRIALKPELLWNEAPDLYDPGAWSESLLRVADLSLGAGFRDESRAALKQLLELRKHADTDSPQSALASKLLERLNE